MTLPTVTVEPHAHQVRMQMPATWGQYTAMAKKQFGAEGKIRDFKLPSMAKNNWNPDPNIREDLVLDDVRLRPFQQSSQVRLSPTKAVHALQMEGRRALNGLEAVALVAAINKGEIKMPVPCEGIHILGAGLGTRILALRQNKHGEWQFAEIPSNHTVNHYFASCKE